MKYAFVIYPYRKSRLKQKMFTGRRACLLTNQEAQPMGVREQLSEGHILGPRAREVRHMIYFT